MTPHSEHSLDLDLIPESFSIGLLDSRTDSNPPFPSVTPNPSLTFGVDVSGDKYLYGVRNQILRDSKKPETHS